MMIAPINNTNNINFGKLREIKLERDFSKNIPEHAAIIKKVCESPVFKEFGEKYDYIAKLEFKILKYFNGYCYYGLKFSPVDNKSTSETEIETPNLPAEFTVTTTIKADKDFAYSEFTKNIEKSTMQGLEYRLEDVLCKQREKLVEIGKRKAAAAAEVLSNINSGEIPIS